MKNFKSSNLTLSWRAVHTSVGEVAVAYTEKGLYALELPGYHPGNFDTVDCSDPAWVQALAEELAAYFLGECGQFSCPLDDADYPPFYQEVLRQTAKIPYGELRSYRWLAAEAKSPFAVRAAGQAMAHNRMPVVVPCHRVLRSDGTLGGFAYGLPWKEKLLTLENAAWEEKKCK